MSRRGIVELTAACSVKLERLGNDLGAYLTSCKAETGCAQTEYRGTCRESTPADDHTPGR